MSGVIWTFRIQGDFERLLQNLTQLPRWMPPIVRSHFLPLSQRVEQAVGDAVSEHRYTGTLENSIRTIWEAQGYRMTVGPTARRGRFDAGLLLEMGTRPIPRAPWAPIRAWAEFRGLPAFPIWYKIRTQGVSPHPFVERAFTAILPRIDETARRVGDDAAVAIVTGVGKLGMGP